MLRHPLSLRYPLQEGMGRGKGAFGVQGVADLCFVDVAESSRSWRGKEAGTRASSAACLLLEPGKLELGGSDAPGVVTLVLQRSAALRRLRVVPG